MRLAAPVMVAVIAGMSGVMIGCSLKPSSTPETTFEALKKAYAADDFGAVYDLLSSSAQKDFSEAVAKMAEKMKDMPPFARQLMGFDFTEVVKLPPRDAFIKMMNGIKESGKLGQAMTGKTSEMKTGLATSIMKACKIDGDGATLTVETAGAASTMDMVRENGVWRLSKGVGPEL